MNKHIKSVIDSLNYKTDNLIESNGKFFDYCYRVNTNGVYCDIIGIKYFNTHNEDEIKRLHKVYWNQNRTPISIIIFDDEIRIYNNYDLNMKTAVLYTSTNISNTFDLEKIQDSSIKSGEFFSYINKYIDPNERVDNKLLKNLEDTIYKINQIDETIKRLEIFDFITKCILIKYLEDRNIITNSTFRIFGKTTFLDILECKKSKTITNFFNYLKEKFSADIFDIDNFGIIRNNQAMNTVSCFFKGEEIETGQTALFPYDFSIIPIELISSIYERFFNIANSSEINLKRKTSGSFYTPYYLANFIIEREVDINNNNFKHIKILDPACGSGVFLVGAFKKIVEHYRNNNLGLSEENLAHIINNQIYGIDNNNQALKITEFSLIIALFDCLDPKDIEINHVSFPKLMDKTLFCASFFQNNCIRNIVFDYVIGNPPWSSFKGDHLTFCKTKNLYISDNQIAQAFVYRANDFIKDNGKIVFILPNGIFFNTLAEEFRKTILNMYSINEILNLGSIKNELFNGASYPCSIVVFEKPLNNSNIKITNFIPNVFSKILNKIVFDFTNSLNILQNQFAENDDLWNIALAGSYFDFLLIKKMTQNYKLHNLCDDYNLIVSQGFTSGNKKDTYSDFNGYNYLNDEINNYHIEKNKLSIITGELRCERIHNKEQYHKHNKLIVRRTLTRKSDTNICALFCNELIYNNKFYCIFDPKDLINIDVLYYVEALLNSKYYFYYQFYTSSSTKLSPPEIRKDKMLQFPIVKYDSKNEIICNIVKTSKNIHNLFEREYENTFFLDNCYNDFDEDNKRILFEEVDNQIAQLYGLTKIDMDTVNHTIDYVIPMLNRYKAQTVQDCDVKNYCENIKKYFSLVLQNNYKLVYDYKHVFGAYIVVFSIKDYADNTPIIIENILSNNLFNFEDLFVTKSIKGFSEDSFYIVKTADKYNWDEFKAYTDYQEFINDSFYN